MQRNPYSRTFCLIAAIAVAMFSAGLVLAQDQEVTPPAKGQLLPAEVSGATPREPGGDFVAVTVSDPATWAADGSWALVEGRWSHVGTDGGNDMLRTPAIALPATASPGDRILIEFEETFELESGYDRGEILISTDGIEWHMLGERTGASEARFSYADVTAWAGESVQIGFRYASDETEGFLGWNLGDLNVTLLRAPTDPLECRIDDLQSTTFPFIYMDVTVETYGEPLPDLVQDDFVAYENGVEQTEYFQVIPPDFGGGTRTADIVFVLDVTGSMGGEISAVRSNMLNFVDGLVAAGVDYRIGFVRFWDYVEVMNSGNLYADYAQIQSVINSFTVSGGGDFPEDSVDAMAEATEMNWRPGAQRIEIMLTDATSHVSDYVGSMSVDQLINSYLLPTNVSVYPVFYTSSTAQQDQYIPIATATNPGGLYFNIYDNFNVIIDDIVERIGSTYRVRYYSSDPTYNCVLRDVMIEVVHDGNLSTCSASYTPCEIPAIERTVETIALSAVQQAELVPLTLAGLVTDDFAPYIDDVRLYYRTTGTAGYSWLAMTDTGGGVWSVDLPGYAVVGPGVDYYLWASDGAMSVSDPTSDPSLVPYQIAVYPNLPPVIEHLPITTLVPAVPQDINAAVSDSTDNVAVVELWHRQYGDLVWSVAPMTTLDGIWYGGVVPAETVVAGGYQYMIRATDNFGVTAVHGIHLVGGPDEPDLGCLWIDGTTGPLADEHDGLAVAWGDYDNDGDDDLFLGNAGWNVLLRNDLGGNYTKMDVDLGAGTSRAGCWADYDDDGDLDLFVVNFGQANVLFRNDGGAFTDVTTPELANEGHGTACAWADVDLNGWLDLFVVNEGEPNVLYLNDGGVLTPDPTSALGFTDLCRGCAFGDYDNDKDPDLYVTVDDGPNYMFRNDRGVGFVDVSAAPVDDSGDGKGCAWADYDNDGFLDLYLVNKDGSNKLFHNDEAGWFVDATDEVVGDEGDGRTAVWGDYDNDGWLDLFVTNYSTPNKLFHNLQNGSFADSTCGALASTYMTAWGAAFNDDDLDGDLDLYVANHTWTGAPNRMFRNTRNSGLWLRIGLEGVASNSHGVGSVIEVITDATTQTRHVTTGANYLSQASVVQHVGIGDATSALLRVTWPSGFVQEVSVSGMEHDITINEAAVTGVDDPMVPTAYTLASHPNPFNPSTTVMFGLPRSSDVTLNIYDVTGRLMRTLVAGEHMTAGTHSVVWDGRDDRGRGTSSGVYFARIVAGEFRDSIRMVLVK